MSESATTLLNPVRTGAGGVYGGMTGPGPGAGADPSTTVTLPEFNPTRNVLPRSVNITDRSEVGGIMTLEIATGGEAETAVIPSGEAPDAIASKVDNNPASNAHFFTIASPQQQP